METEPTLQIQKPFAGYFVITQRFGVLYSRGGKVYNHNGVDWALPNRTEVRAVADGEVMKQIFDVSQSGYGTSVRLQHDGGITLYAHLSESKVRNGQSVKKGDVIGLSGRTGYVRGKTGYHLHFGMKVAGIWVDPLNYFNRKEEVTVYMAEPSDKKIALYRLYNPKTGDHFYTTSEKEARHAALELGYKDESIIGFLYGVK